MDIFQIIVQFVDIYLKWTEETSKRMNLAPYQSFQALAINDRFIKSIITLEIYSFDFVLL